MKKLSDYQSFADELKKLCESYRIGIIGNCASEMIFGEIELFDMDDRGCEELLNAMTFDISTKVDGAEGFFLNPHTQAFYERRRQEE